MTMDSGRFLQRCGSRFTRTASGCDPLGSPTHGVVLGLEVARSPASPVVCWSFGLPSAPPRDSSSPTATSWTHSGARPEPLKIPFTASSRCIVSGVLPGSVEVHDRRRSIPPAPLLKLASFSGSPLFRLSPRVSSPTMAPFPRGSVSRLRRSAARPFARSVLGVLHPLDGFLHPRIPACCGRFRI